MSQMLIESNKVIFCFFPFLLYYSSFPTSIYALLISCYFFFFFFIQSHNVTCMVIRE